MKIYGKECTIERAYDLLAAAGSDKSVLDKLEATAEERERLVTYATLRAHHDYLRDLEAARRGY